MWTLSSTLVVLIVIFLYQPKMSNIVFRRQTRGCLRNAHDLNLKGKKQERMLKCLKVLFGHKKNHTSRTWHTADRWMIQIVAGFIYGICNHAYCEDIIFQSILPSFIKGIRVFVGKVWLPLDNLLEARVCKMGFWSESECKDAWGMKRWMQHGALYCYDRNQDLPLPERVLETPSEKL